MRTRLLIWALAAAGAAAAAQEQPEWKAGVATASITPREPIWMAGYGARKHPSEGVRQDIHVKALALEDTGGGVSVIITADILGFTGDMSANVAARFLKQYGVKRERLVLSASHTHSAPVTGQMLRPAYDMPPEQNAVIDRYTGELLNRVVMVGGQAIKNLQPARLSFAQGLAGFGVNRRRVALRNLPGPVDQDVPVLAVHGADGKLRAILFGYSCHNTTLSDYQINGDYAGYAQHELETLYPGATALFVAGCGADINPLPRRSGGDELAAMYGKILAIAVDLVLKAKMAPVTGPLVPSFGTVDLPFHERPSRAELEARAKGSDAARQRHARHLLAVMDRQGKLPESYPYPVQVWKFGKGLTWIVLGGEVVVDYALRLKSQYGWNTTWVTGYSNDVFAYIPSLRVLKEGGYEGGGAMIPYGQPGAFGAAVEELVVEKVADLAR